jgi:GxxExxY protein
MNKIVDDELTYKIIGCAMKVHNTLGNGFQEVIYQYTLAASCSND